MELTRIFSAKCDEIAEGRCVIFNMDPGHSSFIKPRQIKSLEAYLVYSISTED